MRVYLARHGRCVVGAPGFGDDERYLTAAGRVEATRASARLRALGATPAVVLASPLVRAVQTAELLVSALAFGGEVRSHPALLPGADPVETVEALAELGRDALLVGHAPDMGRRAAFLLGAAGFPAFSPGMVVALDATADATAARFLWALLPGLEDPVETLAELRAAR